MILLMLLSAAGLPSCGRSGDFHKEIEPEAEAEATDEAVAADSAGKLTAAQKLVLRQLELFPR